jgi:hypothetical protein
MGLKPAAYESRTCGKYGLVCCMCLLAYVFDSKFVLVVYVLGVYRSVVFVSYLFVITNEMSCPVPSHTLIRQL